MNPRSKQSTPIKFGPSKTIPGQSLRPAELLKRHLAGTLPDIDLSSKYEHHYDEEGKQVAEPLPLEIHELHKLSVAIRQKQYEEGLEQRKKAAEKHKQDIIDEYVKQNTPPQPKGPTMEEQAKAAEKPKGETPAQKSTPKGRDR